MSALDTCTDMDIESLQKKNMLLQDLVDNAYLENQVLHAKLKEVGIVMKKEVVSQKAKAIDSLGSIMHTYTEPKAPETEELDG